MKKSSYLILSPIFIGIIVDIITIASNLNQEYRMPLIMISTHLFVFALAIYLFGKQAQKDEKETLYEKYRKEVLEKVHKLYNKIWDYFNGYYAYITPNDETFIIELGFIKKTFLPNRYKNFDRSDVRPLCSKCKGLITEYDKNIECKYCGEKYKIKISIGNLQGKIYENLRNTLLSIEKGIEKDKIPINKINKVHITTYIKEFSNENTTR